MGRSERWWVSACWGMSYLGGLTVSPPDDWQ